MASRAARGRTGCPRCGAGGADRCRRRGRGRRAPAVRAVQRHTGVRFDDAWWKGPHWLVRAPEIPEGPPPEPVGLEAALRAVGGLRATGCCSWPSARHCVLRARGGPRRGRQPADAERCADLAGDRSADAITDAALERLIPVSSDLYDEFSAEDPTGTSSNMAGADLVHHRWSRTRSGCGCSRPWRWEGLLRYLPDGRRLPVPCSDFLLHLGYALQDQWPELESRLVRQLLPRSRHQRSRPVPPRQRAVGPPPARPATGPRHL